MSKEIKKSKKSTDVTIGYHLKDNFSPKCRKLTSKLKKIIKEFKEIGIEIDLSFKCDVEKIKESIEIKTI